MAEPMRRDEGENEAGCNDGRRYICACCGAIFREPEQYFESRGEHFGFPSWERMSGCPLCGGDFDELR